MAINKNKEEQKRADELFSSLLEKDLEPTLHEQLKKWFLEAHENSAAEKSLSEWVVRNVKPITTSPDRQTRDSFARLAEKLGFKSRELIPNRYPLFLLRRIASRVAAVLIPALIVAGGIYYYNLLNEEKVVPVEETVLTAGAGEHPTFNLPDGSVVMMGENSELVYSNNFSVRDVKLNGEATFVVAHNANRPFTVQHKDMRVRVLGTEFYIHAHDESALAEVILSNGSVAVNVGKSSTTMTPGEKIIVDKDNGYALELSEARPGELMRAKHSELTIQNTPAREALYITADYFSKSFVAESGVPVGENISLIAPMEMPIEEILTYINRLSGSVTGRLEGNTIIASKNNSTL